MPTKKQSDKKKPLQDTIKKLEQELAQVKQEVQEKNDKLLRAYADLQNLQKRIEKELALKEDETKKKYLLEIIDLSELLHQASTDTTPHQGLRAILQNIETFLEKEQVTYIDCLGKSFDHNYHHAVSTIEKDGCKDGEIVDELKKGYMIGDKLLRPAHIVVAKNKKK